MEAAFGLSACPNGAFDATTEVCRGLNIREENGFAPALAAAEPSCCAEDAEAWCADFAPAGAAAGAPGPLKKAAYKSSTGGAVTAGSPAARGPLSCDPWPSMRCSTVGAASSRPLEVDGLSLPNSQNIFPCINAAGEKNALSLARGTILLTVKKRRREEMDRLAVLRCGRSSAIHNKTPRSKTERVRRKEGDPVAHFLSVRKSLRAPLQSQP